jgi:hypothetical protein
MKSLFRKSIPVIIVFILVDLIVWIFHSFLETKGFSLSFLLIGNLVLFLLGFAGFYIQLRALKADNFNAFLRGIYSSLILKLFVVIIGLSLYLLATHGSINKPSLFTTLGLYIVYTLLEVKQLLKTVRKKPDA